jgi:hypothetical protein
VPAALVDPFGVVVDSASPIAQLGLAREIIDGEIGPRSTPPPSKGVRELANVYWHRIHDAAEELRSDLAARATSGEHKLAARHLRLAMSSDSEVSQLEDELVEVLDVIEWLCISPHVELRFETERTQIDRSRRVARGAIPYLASHSEDWLRVTRRGPVPKQILSQFREDDVAIYENRVVRTLLDGCARWLRELESILRDMQEAEEERLEIESTYYERLTRLARWLNDGDDQQQGSLWRRHQLVDELLRALDSLTQSTLYLGTDEAARVDGLHLTNLLANDGRYAKMVHLWDTWQRQLWLARKASDTDDTAGRTRLADIDTYAHLLSLRALESLCAIDERSGDSVLPDVDIEISAHLIGHRVTFRHLSGIQVVVHLGTVAFSLGASYEPFEEPGDLHESLMAMDGRARARHEIWCLLHPTLRKRIAAAEEPWVRTLGLDAGGMFRSVWENNEGLVVLPAHPLSVDVVEALGRLYRTIIGNLRARAMPFSVPLSGPLSDIPDRAIDVEGSGLVVRERHLVLVEQSIDHSRLGPPHKRGANHPPRPQDATDWAQVLAPLDRMRQGVLMCPMYPVGEGHTAIVEYWEPVGFRAKCRSCSAEWGVRMCSSCGHRYHFMYFHSDQVWQDALSLGHPAEYFGMDLTSEPCSSVRHSTVCPSCHGCPNRGSAETCASCTLR